MRSRGFRAAAERAMVADAMGAVARWWLVAGVWVAAGCAVPGAPGSRHLGEDGGTTLDGGHLAVADVRDAGTGTDGMEGGAVDVGGVDRGTVDVTCAPPATDGGAVPYYECASAPICPRSRFGNDPMRPGYRFTYLAITQPQALASAALLSVFNGALARGTFLWGLQIDLTSNTFRTGGLNLMFTRGTTGVGLMDGQFAFFNNNGPGATPARYNPISGALTVTGDRTSTATVATTVNIPIFSDETGTMLLTQLPMDNTRISNIHLASDRGCVGMGVPSGGRYTETTSRWMTQDPSDVPYGTLDADITVENTRVVTVNIGGNATPFCNVIAGANCATDPMRDWPRQPDSTVNGMPAYHLRANFAAISANIAR